MVRVAGLWELGYNTPLMELDLWQYPLREFEVEEFYMSPITGIQSNYVKEVANLGELIKTQRNLGFEIVFVDEKGDTKLQQFQHPENVLYVFGKATRSSMNYFQEGDKSLVIETPQNTGMLWPHQCIVTILYDRMKKWQ